jgi:hypothetical protein
MGPTPIACDPADLMAASCPLKASTTHGQDLSESEEMECLLTQLSFLLLEPKSEAQMGTEWYLHNSEDRFANDVDAERTCHLGPMTENGTLPCGDSNSGCVPGPSRKSNAVVAQQATRCRAQHPKYQVLLPEILANAMRALQCLQSLQRTVWLPSDQRNWEVDCKAWWTAVPVPKGRGADLMAQPRGYMPNA